MAPYSQEHHLTVLLVAGSRRRQPDSGSLLPTLLTAAIGARVVYVVLKGILLGSQDPIARIMIGVVAALGGAALFLMTQTVTGRYGPSLTVL